MEGGQRLVIWRDGAAEGVITGAGPVDEIDSTEIVGVELALQLRLLFAFLLQLVEEPFDVAKRIRLGRLIAAPVRQPVLVSVPVDIVVQAAQDFRTPLLDAGLHVRQQLAVVTFDEVAPGLALLERILEV